MKTYKHIFFDLDDTLWDFTANSKESLMELYELYTLGKYFNNFEHFINTYQKHNLELWKKYINKDISKFTLGLTRFLKTLNEVGIDEAKMSGKLNTEYLAILSTKTTLLPAALNTLRYLNDKYQIHILTNGFLEVQLVKIQSSKIDRFLTHIILAEECESFKPSKEIFEESLDKIKAKASECIMIGDDFKSDIIGAKNNGIDQIFLNRKNQQNLSIKPTFEIKKLEELKNIL